MKLFSLLALGAFINSIGTGLTAFGVATFVYTTFGNASAIALTQLAAFAPIVLLSPVAGVLADRLDRRLVMMAGDGGSVIGLAVVWFAVTQPNPNLGLILAGLVLSSVFAAFTEPALRASVNDLVGEKDYVRTSGMLQFAASAKYLFSPLLAGLLLRYSNLGILLLIDMSTCLVTVVCSLAVRKAYGAASHASSEEGFLSQLRSGLRSLTASRPVVVAVVLMTVLTFSLGFLQTLLKPVLLPIASVEQVGIAETITAVGMFAGAGMVALVGKGAPHRLLAMGIAGVGVAMVCLALVPNRWWIAGCGFIVFASLSLCNAGGDVVVRTSIDNKHQGRAWGAIGFLSQLGFIMAYVVAGPLADGVFEPLLRPGGSLSGSIGTLIGTGAGRGTALLIATLGVGTLLLAIAPLTVRMADAPKEPPASNDGE